jgi:pimeloyl-ACP methyl ester carboxylesterase
VVLDPTTDDFGLGNRPVRAVAVFYSDDRLSGRRFALVRGVPHFGISSGVYEIAHEIASRVRDYDIGHLTGDLVGLLDALGIDKAVFIGHDWGGLLAWQMALPGHRRCSLARRPPFMADPKVDPIVQMRQVYSPDMYVLLFEDGQVGDKALDRDPSGTIRNSYRKDLITSAEWGKMPAEVANMEYYGKPIPDQLPGRYALNASELDFYAQRFQRTGFTPAINWYRNIPRNWKAGLDVDQTVRVPP